MRRDVRNGCEKEKKWIKRNVVIKNEPAMYWCDRLAQ